VAALLDLDEGHTLAVMEMSLRRMPANERISIHDELVQLRQSITSCDEGTARASRALVTRVAASVTREAK
jgi:hypothetical protein